MPKGQILLYNSYHVINVVFFVQQATSSVRCASCRATATRLGQLHEAGPGHLAPRNNKVDLVCGLPQSHFLAGNQRLL
jgi:hypothetical protein